jgi:hypothetical protein
MGLGRWQAIHLFTWTYTSQTTSWLLSNWSTLVHGRATGKHGFTRFTMARTWGKPHLPPYSIFYAWPWDQHPKVILSQDSQVGVPKFPKLGLPRFWSPITLCADLRFRWGLKKNFSHGQQVSNSMLHATCTQGNQGDSRLLVVRSQIVNLTLDFSFGHNLFFRYPNGSCKPF